MKELKIQPDIQWLKGRKYKAQNVETCLKKKGLRERRGID
jgi:hypothetical protein